jgi:calcium-dependent protein kinase
MGQSLQAVGLEVGTANRSPRKKKTLVPIDEDLEGFNRAMFAQEKRGKIADNFEMLEELGSGSFGSVSRARDVRNECFVAVKTIPKKKVGQVDKIKEEFNVIRQMDHPNICKAFESYEDRKNIYLVIELLTGGTLLQSLCKQSKFTEADAGSIMRQILSALAYLHQANFIFRDLKTENVMFTSPPSLDAPVDSPKGDSSLAPLKTQRLRREIKLIDFGLCCPFEKGSKLCKAAGTPYSVAPELITAPIQYDQKCDAWSSGVIMYIMLSGKYPFSGKTKEELLHTIRKEPCSFLNPIWKLITKEGKTLLVELLRKKVDQRISVTDALMHPWINRQTFLPTENILAGIVDSFNHFQNLNMFEKAAVTALAWRADDEDTAHLREIFQSLDKDGNGHITVQELRSVIETAGINVCGDLEQLACDADTDGGGTIEYTEFLAATLDKQKVIKEDVIWQAFSVFDQDGSGTITKSELLKILTGSTADKIRRAHGNKAVDNFLDEYDASGDAVIDFDEFMDMLQGVKDTYQGLKTARSVRSEADGRSPRTSRRSPRIAQQSPQRSPQRVLAITATKEEPKESGMFACCPCSRVVKDVPESLSTGILPVPQKQSDLGTMGPDYIGTSRRSRAATGDAFSGVEEPSSPMTARRKAGRAATSPVNSRPRRDTEDGPQRSRQRHNTSPRSPLSPRRQAKTN